MANSFDISGRRAVLTGGYGVLVGSMAHALANAGVRVAVLGRNGEKANAFAAGLGPEHLGLAADVTDEAAVAKARDTVLAAFGGVEILVNGAGGQRPGAIVQPEASVFSASVEAFRQVFDLNLTGTLIPSLVFGEALADSGRGAIVNISSVAADTPVSRAGAYNAAKAGIDNLTGWMAGELARRHAGALRVNAIRPGFFLADQNRRLLTNEDGSLTDRGAAIVGHTPMGRFGQPEELHGALLWLVSDAAAFVTGTVVTVDGGFGVQRGV